MNIKLLTKIKILIKKTNMDYKISMIYKKQVSTCAYLKCGGEHISSKLIPKRAQTGYLVAIVKDLQLPSIHIHRPMSVDLFIKIYKNS